MSRRIQLGFRKPKVVGVTPAVKHEVDARLSLPGICHVITNAAGIFKSGRTGIDKLSARAGERKK